MRRTTRLLKRKRYDGWDVHSETTGGKRLEGQGNVALGFINLDKSYDTVPREMVMASLKSMCVPDAEMRISEEFRLNVSQREVP